MTYARPEIVPFQSLIDDGLKEASYLSKEELESALRGAAVERSFDMPTHRQFGLLKEVMRCRAMLARFAAGDPDAAEQVAEYLAETKINW